MAEIRTLTETGQVDELLAASGERPVWLFKHSLICGVSARAWREFQEFAASRPDGESFFLVEIQRSRDLSKAIAERTGVRHQSPQAMLLRDGEVVWHASHRKIRRDALAAVAATPTPTAASG